MNSCVVEIVDRIVRFEEQRGEISRAERSRLCSESQPLQDLLDRVLFRSAGLTDQEAAALEDRLAKML